MDQCSKCGTAFARTERQIKKSDWSCKPCINERQRAYYQSRVQAGDPISRTWKRTASQLKEYKAANLAKFRARETLRYAVSIGTITRKPCEICGTEKTEGHHTDYSQPLNVKWLCRTHHIAEHRTIANGDAT